LIPLLCFIPVFYYGWKGHRVKVVQEDVIEKVGYNV